MLGLRRECVFLRGGGVEEMVIGIWVDGKGLGEMGRWGDGEKGR